MRGGNASLRHLIRGKQMVKYSKAEVRRLETPVGTRPAVAAQLIREYIYLYGAVSPKDGTCVYLIMPTSNTASFQAFLQVVFFRIEFRRERRRSPAQWTGVI